MEGFLQFIADMGTVWSRYGMSFIRGAGLTFVLALACTAVGCLIGFAVGTVQAASPGHDGGPVKRALRLLLRALLKAYVEFFRGTPLMLQAMFIFYGSSYIGIHMDYIPAGILILSINTGAYMAETVRGGVMAIDPGQTEGAKAIGMTHMQTMLYVILPQTLRNLVPQIGNNYIINLKDSSMLSVISVSELFFSFRTAASALYLYFPAATIAMALYLTMTLISAKLLRLWESRLAGTANYELVMDEPGGLPLRTGGPSVPDHSEIKGAM